MFKNIKENVNMMIIEVASMVNVFILEKKKGLKSINCFPKKLQKISKLNLENVREGNNSNKGRGQ